MVCAYRYLLLAAIPLGLLLSSGCSMLDLKSNWLAGEKPLTELPAVTGDRVFIELYPEKGSPMKTVLPLKPGTVVSQALQRSGTLDRFKRMDVTLIRKSPQAGEIKMELPYEHSKRRIEPRYDYALYPNDRVVVEERVATALDDLMRSVGGGLFDRYHR